jgi:hypothetical protein
MESSPSMLVFEVNVGFCFHQRMDACELALSGCEMESSPAVHVVGVDVGSGILQRSDALGVALLDCVIESRPSLVPMKLLVSDVGVGSGFLQRSDAVGVALLGCEMESSLFKIFLVICVHSFPEEGSDEDVGMLCCLMLDDPMKDIRRQAIGGLSFKEDSSNKLSGFFVRYLPDGPFDLF